MSAKKKNRDWKNMRAADSGNGWRALVVCLDDSGMFEMLLPLLVLVRPDGVVVGLPDEHGISPTWPNAKAWRTWLEEQRRETLQ
jgi:hypothetical protein